MKVEAIGEPIILNGDVEKLAANFFACDARSIETNPAPFPRDSAERLGAGPTVLWGQSAQFPLLARNPVFGRRWDQSLVTGKRAVPKKVPRRQAGQRRLG
jgi:hypothetical protein